MNNDLISRAALLERFEKAQSNVGTLVETVFFDGVMGMVDTAPAVDAEPVRHGRWIQSKTVPSYHSCSYCKRAHNMPKSCNVYVLPHYCPNCGAKMDLEVQDGKNNEE